MLTSPANKHYVGQHKTENVSTRIKTHIAGCKSYNDSKKSTGCIALYRAINKYSIENFTCQILESNVTLENLSILEDAYIIKYNTLAPNGYNLRLNNGVESLHTLSEETRKRFSEAAVIKNKQYIDKYRRYKEEMQGMPQYVVFYKDKNGYRGYKIANHPKCSSKSFTSKHEPLEILKEKCLQFIGSLSDTAYGKPERNLPVGICKPTGNKGYKAYYQKDGIRHAKYFNNFASDEENLNEAKTWLTSNRDLQLSSTFND